MTVLPQSVTTSSLTLTWQPPSLESHNGIIRQYVIEVVESNTGITSTVTSNVTEVTVEDLHPFYIYNCRIAAETIQVGPFSSPIAVQLNEDGKQR